MKLTDVSFNRAVRIGKRMAERAPEAIACAFGVLVPHDEGATLIPWHEVRWAEGEMPPEAPRRGRPPKATSEA